jgi:kynurenine formamidase
MAVRAFAAGIALALAAGHAGAQESWYPSKYGAADTLGAVNNLSAAGVVEAARLVKTGKTYSLGITVNRDTPAYGTRTFQIFTSSFTSASGMPSGSNKLTGNDDLLITWVGIGTQLDGFGHIGIDHRYYNGAPVADVLRPDGLVKYGTDKLPPIATRGVLLDAAGHRGVERLPAGTALQRADLEAIAKKQGVTIGKGDVVLIHTGWLSLGSQDKKAFLAGEPGLGKEGAEYLASLGVVAVGADSWGVEAVPAVDPGEAFPVHQILLAKNGVYIMENVQTAELAADGAHEFLFVLGAPKFQGAVQAPIHPIAIR